MLPLSNEDSVSVESATSPRECAVRDQSVSVERSISGVVPVSKTFSRTSNRGKTSLLHRDTSVKLLDAVSSLRVRLRYGLHRRRELEEALSKTFEDVTLPTPDNTSSCVGASALSSCTDSSESTSKFNLVDNKGMQEKDETSNKIQKMSESEHVPVSGIVDESSLTLEHESGPKDPSSNTLNKHCSDQETDAPLSSENMNSNSQTVSSSTIVDAAVCMGASTNSFNHDDETTHKNEKDDLLKAEDKQTTNFVGKSDSTEIVRDSIDTQKMNYDKPAPPSKGSTLKRKRITLNTKTISIVFSHARKSLNEAEKERHTGEALLAKQRHVQNSAEKRNEETLLPTKVLDYQDPKALQQCVADLSDKCSKLSEVYEKAYLARVQLLNLAKRYGDSKTNLELVHEGVTIYFRPSKMSDAIYDAFAAQASVIENEYDAFCVTVDSMKPDINTSLGFSL